MFGDAFWDFTIIGVSHWAFDSNSIAERNHTGKNEEWFLAQWNKQFKDKFHMEKDLSGVFIDSWSQQPWNIEDPGQQDIFQVSFYLGTHSMKILENFKTFLLNLTLFRKRLGNCGGLLNKMDYFLLGP